MQPHFRSWALLGLMLALAACSQPAPENGTASQPEHPASPLVSGQVETSAATDAWLGKWNGPEGTYLQLWRQKSHGHGRYRITIANLDGPLLYESLGSTGDTIQFERNGITETLHAGDGKATGMKWLADKHDCLTIRQGEGYCRD